MPFLYATLDSAIWKVKDVSYLKSALHTRTCSVWISCCIKKCVKCSPSCVMFNQGSIVWCFVLLCVFSFCVLQRYFGAPSNRLLYISYDGTGTYYTTVPSDNTIAMLNALAKSASSKFKKRTKQLVYQNKIKKHGPSLRPHQAIYNPVYTP